MALAPKEHLSQHDREIAAIRKLVLTGMKMLNGLTESQRETGRAIRDLAASQRKTDEQLQVLVRPLQ